MGRKPQGSRSPAPGPTQDIPKSVLCASPVPESAVQTLLVLWQVWCCDCSSGEPVPVPDHSLRKEPLSNIQPNSPLTQLQAVPLGPRKRSESAPPSPLRGSLLTPMSLPLSLLSSRLKKRSAPSCSSQGFTLPSLLPSFGCSLIA